MPAKGFRQVFCKRGHLKEENRAKDGRCKLCNKARVDKWKLEHPEQYRKLQRKWEKENIETLTINSRRYRKDHPEAVQSTRLKQRYGITKADQEAQIAEQDNKCAICRQEFGPDCKPETDHDHATDKVRGQLCHYCNVMLGQAKDNMQTLLNAVEYLRRNKK